MAQDLDRLDTLEKEIQQMRRDATISSKDRQYEIKPNVIREIQKIVDKIPRYNNVNDFVDESIRNTINFWSQPERMQQMAGELWPSFTSEMKLEIKKNAPVFYHTMEAAQERTKIKNMVEQLPDAKASLSRGEKFSTPENIVSGDAYSLMHQSYNRFFPLKILVTTLGLMIEENKKQENKFDKARWVDYEKFSKDSFDIALEFSDKLKAIKGKKGDKRNMRISTGLPISHEASFTEFSEIYPKMEEKIEKDEKSKQRFFDCFIGPKAAPLLRAINAASKEGKRVLSGALNETGLVYVRNNNGKVEITLSEDGFEFFNYDNPFIDDISIERDDNGIIQIIFNTNTDGLIEKKIFSKEETKFIRNTIIPKFTLEKQIIDDIVTKIKEDGKVKAKVLDGVIENSVLEWKKDNQDIAEKQKIDEKNKDVYRIATMGRLAEIGVVNWEIEDGISIYSIST